MIYKPLRATDYRTLKPFFAAQPYTLSVYSLLSLIVWSDCLYQTSYLIDGDRLILACESALNPDDRYLMLPLFYSEATVTAEYLHDLAVDCGFNRYCFVPGDFIEKLGAQKIACWFRISGQPEFDDYLYLTEDLTQLKGNRYAKKRNLLHQFHRDYAGDGRVEVADLKAEDRDECLTFLDLWCQQRRCDIETDASLSCEKRAVISALHAMEELEGKGLVVRIDGSINAFAISSRLNEETGVLNFEKAFSSVRGLYQFLDNECARRLFPGYRYINKESDLNVPELAQSKKSYHPVSRIRSCCLTIA
jgi:uncharacterized protein